MKIAACAAVLLVAGCQTLRLYPGDPLEKDRTAQIVPTHETHVQILILEVDGIPLTLLQDRVEVLPGPHVLLASVLISAGSRRATGTHRLEFVAEASRVYRVRGDWYVYGARIWVEDLASGDRVALAETRPPVGAGLPRSSRRH